ncbi:sensor domain-containing protein [Azospirillum halopraeferens]|uniref:sensor domain-containing protein n=1 Tax=Azospirillum halopraeferens TaxID=34010 RepID=UPI0004098F5D|nr:EAL domain-containing protein [Azospirillum halopraeferens]
MHGVVDAGNGSVRVKGGDGGIGLPPDGGAEPRQWMLSILQGLPVATFVIDADHRVTHWNRACEVMIGVAADRMIGTRDQWRAFYTEPRPILADLIVDGIGEEVLTRLYPGRWARSSLIEGAYEAESYFPHFPGGGRWMSFTAAPLHDADGRIIGAIETLQDISERKRAEAAERERDADRRLAEVVRNSPFPTFVLDTEHRVTVWNRACEAVIGVPADAVVGTRLHWQAFYDRERPVMADLVLDGVPEEAIAAHYPGKCRRSLYIDGAYDAEDFFPKCPGGGRWLSFTAAPIHDAAGRVVGAIETMHDVTEARLSAEALHLYQRAVESATNGIIISDMRAPDNPVVYANPAFERMTGYRAEEVVGCNARFLLAGDRDQIDLQSIKSALRQHRPGSGVLRNYRKDGTLFWNELFVAPVRDGAGVATHTVSVMTDITERRRYEEELEHQANHDALTGLANRSLMKDRLEHALTYAQRYHGKVATLFVDLDNFKTINDTLGHGVGDRLVQAVAKRLVNCLRDVDTVARLGGDEFVIIVYNPHDESDVTQVMRRIMETLNKPFRIDEAELYVTCSIGAALSPRDGSDVDTLLKHADAAMYRAKELGRGGFQFFTREINEQVSERMAIERELHGAIARNELEVHYQPQVDVRTGAIMGAEALLRWTNPRLGAVSPARFIPVAEESGLILSIGRWVLETACHDSKRWIAEGWTGARLSVNLSARQFRQTDLFRHIEELLQDAHLSSLVLELELTESMVMQNPEAAIGTMRALKDIGLRLAIDDFGTGYSSLSHLRHFPLDILKVDQTFVRDISSHSDGEAIAAAVISIGHALGKKVVAEGVEQPEQLDFLRGHGCDEYQGFLFSRAVPAGRFRELLKHNGQLPDAVG